MKNGFDLASRSGRRRRTYSQFPHAMLATLPIGPVPSICRHAATPPRPRTRAMRQAMALAFVTALLPLGAFRTTLSAAFAPPPAPTVFAARPAPTPLVGGVMLSFASSMR